MAAGVHEGDVLMGKYRIERILGEGGMGVVAAAYHQQLDQRVAIKFLLPAALSNPQTVARFAREARSAVKIKSEHVARVIDVGQLENGAPYMVMEFLDGIDLAERLRKYGPLPVPDAVEFILQACEAVAEAHSLGIIHRDLKPANIFVIRRRDGTESAKLLDFGISKTTDSATTGPEMAMTSTKAIMGSPYYMSPEQLMSARDVDAGTDIWALGVVLYELLAGRLPFSSDSFAQLCMSVIQDREPPLRAFRHDAPPELEAVVHRCLEKTRAKRYPTVAEFAADLGPFAPNRAQVSVDRVSRVLASAGLLAAPSPPANVAVGDGPDGPTADAHSGGAVLTSGGVANAPTGGAGGTQATWGRSTYRTPKGAGTALAAAGLVALTLLGGGSLALWAWLRSDSENSSVGAAASALEEASPAPSASLASPVETPEVAPVEAGSATGVASAEAPEPSRAAPASRWQAATPTKPKPVTHAPTPVRPVPSPVPKPATHAAGSPPPILYGDRK